LRCMMTVAPAQSTPSLNRPRRRASPPTAARSARSKPGSCASAGTCSGVNAVRYRDRSALWSAAEAISRRLSQGVCLLRVHSAMETSCGRVGMHASVPPPGLARTVSVHARPTGAELKSTGCEARTSMAASPNRGRQGCRPRGEHRAGSIPATRTRCCRLCFLSGFCALAFVRCPSKAGCQKLQIPSLLRRGAPLPVPYLWEERIK
jgi:hypothetical protein